MGRLAEKIVSGFGIPYREELHVAKSPGYSSAEVKAGLFLTFCLALFVAMLFVYGKAARLWRGRR